MPPLLSERAAGEGGVVSSLERKIDQLVYKLYDLSPEEIAIVEGNG